MRQKANVFTTFACDSGIGALNMSNNSTGVFHAP
jgi:hypothetical protein